MKITIKHKYLKPSIKTFDISINLYNRHTCLGIDFDKSQGQIIFDNISIKQAKIMITELTDYIYDQET